MRKIVYSAISALLLCGCSIQEVNDRIPVASAAIERSEKLIITAQTVAVSSADSVPKTKLETIKADTVRQAIDLSGDKTYWSTAETMLLYKKAADKIYSLINQLSQEQSIRPAVRLCVIKDGKSTDIFDSEQQADGLQTLLDDGVRNGQAVSMPLYKAKNIADTEGMDLVLPVVKTDGDSVRLGGTAFYDGEHFAGWLDERQTGMLALLRNDTRQTVLYDEDASRYELTNTHSKITVKSDKNGNPQAEIAVKAKLKSSSETDEQGAAILAGEQCIRLIKKLQSCGCDALGLGQSWYRNNPDDFSDWKDIYKKQKIKIKVEIKRTQGGDAE